MNDFHFLKFYFRSWKKSGRNCRLINALNKDEKGNYCDTIPSTGVALLVKNVFSRALALVSCQHSSSIAYQLLEWPKKKTTKITASS